MRNHCFKFKEVKPRQHNGGKFIFPASAVPQVGVGRIRIRALLLPRAWPQYFSISFIGLATEKASDFYRTPIGQSRWV